MPRTLDEPGFCREPAGFAARRLQIDVLWIAKKLGRRGAEENHAPGVNGVGQMNEAAFGIDVAQTMLYEKRGLLESGLSIEAMRDAVYLLFLDDAELNDFNSFFSKERDNLSPLRHRKILGRTVVSFPGPGRQKFHIEAVMDGHVRFRQEPPTYTKRLLAREERYLV